MTPCENKARLKRPFVSFDEVIKFEETWSMSVFGNSFECWLVFLTNFKYEIHNMGRVLLLLFESQSSIHVRSVTFFSAHHFF